MCMITAKYHIYAIKEYVKSVQKRCGHIWTPYGKAFMSCRPSPDWGLIIEQVPICIMLLLNVITCRLLKTVLVEHTSTIKPAVSYQ
jgi:hypothetical protein